MLVRVEDLSRGVVSGVTFGVKENEVMGILGMNGAGKSQIMKVLAQEWRREGGNVRLLG
jgi:ABC-type multidrug transport system ATPase subunit